MKVLTGRRVVLLGIGHPEMGDDAAGHELARRLQEQGFRGAIAAGNVPENYLGPVLALRPEVILIADAVEMGKTPGAWVLLDGADLAAGSLSTHDASLSLLMDYLIKESEARCYLLGIQANSRAGGEGISPEVEETVAGLAHVLGKIVALS
ncbi:MAG: hydrogenase maturation protease [Candidatus Aureabacteria bacterium]|nr:hydrogenase maturation protease [Candidatus Auribacterota bacterium]